VGGFPVLSAPHSGLGGRTVSIHHGAAQVLTSCRFYGLFNSQEVGCEEAQRR
jgi:hypothetical protein